MPPREHVLVVTDEQREMLGAMFDAWERGTLRPAPPTPPERRGTMAVIGSQPGDQIIGQVSTQTFVANDARSYNPATGSNSTNNTIVAPKMRRAGTINGFSVLRYTNGATAGNLTLTVWKNGAPTGLFVVFAFNDDTATWHDSTGAGVAFAPGDTISIRATTDGAYAGGAVSWISNLELRYS
ncbi:MAG: hypothetical protein QOE90_925 [Thermoplasmata archaeon]|nr:hypothetical protein [Thermoplasmata archaeon]